MRFVIVSIFLLVTIASVHDCQGESIFKKFAHDIKHAADKVADGIKDGAEDVGHGVKEAAEKTAHGVKKAADDVGHVFSHFRKDVSVAWIKAKPYIKTAYTVVDGVLKPLDEIEEAVELFKLLDVAGE